ncbi:MAG: cupin domain-containing protein, partial [Eubacteriales bacterium]
MKALVTAETVKSHAKSGQTSMEIPAAAIITPAARDAAGELGIKFLTQKAGANTVKPAGSEMPGRRSPALSGEQPRSVPGGQSIVSPGKSLDEGLVQKIVQAVLAELSPAAGGNFVKEADPGGLMLVRGNTVKLDSFDTGNPKDRVGIKNLLTTGESPHMAAGFMTMDRCSFPWELNYEEVDYIIEGTLELEINGVTYRGGPGDVFYIPANSNIKFKCQDRVKFFYVTYPANWAELSEK